MLSLSNQPGQLYGISKTQKFDNIAIVTVHNLKFCLNVVQSWTYTSMLKSNC